MRTLTIILCLALAQCGLSPAWAQTVEVPDVAPDYAAGGPEDMEFVTANAGGDLAMLYQVPTTPADGLDASTPASAYPLTVQSASGADTRLGVDLAAADKATEGWPWYAKAGVVVGCVALVGLATWGIVEASHSGSHDHDSSTHYTIYGDDGATLNVRIGADNTTTSSSTTTGW